MNTLPPSIADCSDDDLLARYSDGVPDGPWLRVNFVTTLDGSASAGGRTADLGGDDDLRVFDLLRRTADVVLVAAGTVRDEEYGPMVLHDADVDWRRAHGLPDHPVFAIVTGSAGLDPSSRVFTEAPVRPVVLTSASGASSDRGGRSPRSRTSWRAATTPWTSPPSCGHWPTGVWTGSTAREGRRSSGRSSRRTWSTNSP